VEFNTADEAQEAYKAMKGQEIDGRQIFVEKFTLSSSKSIKISNNEHINIYFLSEQALWLLKVNCVECKSLAKLYLIPTPYSSDNSVNISMMG
jgi:RNA recognition motif-containing protein